jgi:hypothetical protein
MQPAMRSRLMDPLSNPRLRHAFLALLTVVVLYLDYVTGPAVHWPAWLVLPIVVAAWYDGFIAGSILAILLPLARIAFMYIWPGEPWSTTVSYINFTIRVSAMEVIALLVSQAGRIMRELHLLRGLLPICMYCHRIRTEGNQWEKLEAYFTKRTEARFTHAICSYCQTEHATA